jgi:hypothetical protein
VQRKDVDGFFGRVFESDFARSVRVQSSSSVADVLRDPDLTKKLRPRVHIDGRECEHHHDRGDSSATHSPVLLKGHEGDPIRLVLHKSEAEIASAQIIHVTAEADFRLAVLVSLIKAAYLTLFRLLGYGYALSAAGLSVGHDLLGRFYRENCGKPDVEARAAARGFFEPYVHMARPVDNIVGTPPLGTVEDHRGMVCFDGGGRPFGLIVFVRADGKLYGVLVPYFSDADAVATHHKFLSNEKELLRASMFEFNPQKRQFNYAPQSIEMVWPKPTGGFGLT